MWFRLNSYTVGIVLENVHNLNLQVTMLRFFLLIDCKQGFKYWWRFVNIKHLNKQTSWQIADKCSWCNREQLKQPWWCCLNHGGRWFSKTLLQGWFCQQCQEFEMKLLSQFIYNLKSSHRKLQTKHTIIYEVSLNLIVLLIIKFVVQKWHFMQVTMVPRLMCGHAASFCSCSPRDTYRSTTRIWW